MHCERPEAPGCTEAENGWQVLKTPTVHHPVTLHCLQAPPLAPSNPGAHTQSVSCVERVGLLALPGHATHAVTLPAPSVGWYVAAAQAVHTDEAIIPVPVW
jgi:hypothetical protein